MKVFAMMLMQVGFFADAGPLQLFVSNHLIPEDFTFDSANEPAFVSSDEAVRVQAGVEVRLRIVGTRVDADEIVSPRLSSRDPSYLGACPHGKGPNLRLSRDRMPCAAVTELDAFSKQDKTLS